MDDLQNLDRRQVLKVTTGFLCGLVVAGSPLAALAKDRAWAVELSVLTSAEARMLVAMVRTLLPHDKLDELAYAGVVHSIDRESRKDQNLLQLLKRGMRDMPAEFAKLPERDRVDALKGMESSEFFATMRVKAVELLYASPLAYACFGYQGESFSKGGYLFRGFNDLHWLPDVPVEDSGPFPIH